MNNFLSNPALSVYPGAFVPILKEEEVIEQLKMVIPGNSSLPSVYITEFDDSYKLEIAIPGFKREDFMIHTTEDIMSIRVLHQEDKNSHKCNLLLNKCNYQLINRHINLPEDADTSFVSAEYKDGKLFIHLSKQKSVTKRVDNLIVVY